MRPVSNFKHGEEGQEHEYCSENEKDLVVIIRVFHQQSAERGSEHGRSLREKVIQPCVCANAFFITVVVHEGETVHVHPRPEESN